MSDEFAWMDNLKPEQAALKLGDRVSEHGSWRCATIVQDWGDSCLIEFDYYIPQHQQRFGGVKRTEYAFKKYLWPTDYYNECWNAWCAQEDDIPSVAPEWKGR